VVTDDLCMGAVTTPGPVAAAARDAFFAGHDLLLIAHDVNAMRDSVEQLRALAGGGGLPAARLRASLSRVEGLAARPRPARGAPSLKEGEALGLAVARRALEVVSRGAVSLPLAPGGGPPLVLFPDFAEVRERFTFEGGPRGPERLVRGLLARWGAARLMRTPLETTRNADRLARAVRDADRVVLFLFEALRFPGQDAALSAVKAAARKAVVCLIRSPWDRGRLPRGLTALDAYGYRSSQLRAALEVVLGAAPGMLK